VNDNHDNEAAGRLERAAKHWQQWQDTAALAFPVEDVLDRMSADALAVLAENKTMRQRLGLVAEEVRELPEMCRNLVGPRCGEAYDRSREARRLVGEWQPAEGDE
jgi:hypothetical protein